MANDVVTGSQRPVQQQARHFGAVAWLMLPNLAAFMAWMGTLQVLLPSHVAQIAPADKVETLGHISGLGALFAAVANPVFGALSDRTRTRFGRRAPWILACAVGTAISFAMTAAADTVLALTIGLCAVQILSNGLFAVITAVMPERIPVERRGLAASAIGLCFPLGVMVGTGLASRFVENIPGGYLALALVCLVAGLGFVAFNPDPQHSLPPPAGSTSLRGSIGAFFSVMAVHDFRWTFVSRFFTILTFSMVSGFMLFLLQDHVRLDSGLSTVDVLVQVNGVQMSCMMLATLVCGPWSDYVGRRRVFVLVSALGMGASLVWLLVVPTHIGIISFAALNGLAFGAYLAVDAALITQVLPDESNVARDLGILNIANAGPQIMAPFVSAQVVTYLGGYSALLGVAAASAVVSGLSVLRIRGVR